MDEMRFNYSNAVKVLDCVETVVSYKKYLTKAEHTIDDPLNMSRLIMRRILKDTFGAFNIRKNMTEYAMKCEDENIYKILYVAYHVTRDTGVMGRLSPTLRAKVSAICAPAEAMLTEIGRGGGGVHFSFKDERRFFLYVNFLPMMNNTYFDRENFNRYSLKSRIEKVLRAAESLKVLKFDDVLNALLTLFEENSGYEIFRLDRVGLQEVDEGFLAFYLSKEVSNRRNQVTQVAREYIQYLKDQKTEEDKALDAIHEAEIPLKTLQARPRPRPTLTRITEPARTATIGLRPTATPTAMPTGIRLRAPEAVEIVETPVDEEDVELLEALEVYEDEEVEEEVVDDAQNIFRRALERMALERAQGIREFQLPALATIEMAANEVDIDCLDPVHGAMITRQAFGLYLKSVDKKNDIGFKITNIDMYDDIDSDKDGAYFTIIDKKPIYFLFKDSEEIFSTTSKEELVAECVKLFGKAPDAVNFFVDERTSLFAQGNEYEAAEDYNEFDEDIDTDDDDEEEDEEIEARPFDGIPF